MEKTSVLIGVFSLVSFLMLSGVSSACIGLAAGKVHINVSAGYSGVGQVIIINGCDFPIDFDAFTQLYANPNMTTPNMTSGVAHGILAPRVTYVINVTVFMPANAVPGTTWTGGLAAIEAPNSTVEGAANLNTGVSKIITVVALTAPINYFQYEVIAIVILIIIAIAIVLHYYLAKRRKKNAGAPFVAPASSNQ